MKEKNNKIFNQAKHFFKPKIWLIVLIMYAIAISLSVLIAGWQNNLKLNTAQAGAEHNVSGYGWSENFGWVSFNCVNDNSCAAVNYGVNINSISGNFSGYAWSENLGWIDFNPAGVYPEAPNTPARYDSGTGAVTGWAKILTLGDEGWLKMSGAWANGITINSFTGDFSGWAWNGNDTGAGLGWLSFNCADNGAGGCAGSNYKVIGNINSPPAAVSLTAPNWSYVQAGQLGALKAFLKWQFSDPNPGAAESAYQIIVDTDNNPVTPPLIDTGQCLGYQNPAVSCLINSGVDSYPVHDQINLAYNTKYYWWVKVWDNYGLASALKQYDTEPDTDNDDGDPLTFTTYKHEFPDVDFTWFPFAPSKGEKVKFSDASKYYTGAAPATPNDCGGGHCSYFWTVPADADINNNSDKNPQITFNSLGQQSVTLKVTDDDGYSTSLTKTLNLKQKLPNWREVKPE